MRYTEDQVKVDLKKYYGYSAHAVRTVYGGTVAYTFVVDDLYFLKIYDDALSITARCTEHLNEQLAVLNILRESTALADRICYPVKTADGALFFRYGAYTGVLFNCISGAAIGFDRAYTEEEAGQLREIVRTLHGLDAAMFEGMCPKETFDLRWCAKLEHIALNECGNMSPRFGELVADYRKAILKNIGLVYDLAAEIRRMDLPFVLCHTDVHAGNVMRTPEGKIYLIDWENVVLAPREADLFAFVEEEGMSSLAEGTNPTAMCYYTVRRDLEDVYEFLCSELNREFDEKESDEVFGHVTRILGYYKEQK